LARPVTVRLFVAAPAACRIAPTCALAILST
jgi:hypothetical protein